MNGIDLHTEALDRACAETLPATDARPLLDQVARVVPDLDFRLALTRDGWYRVGGVVGADGERIADNLRDWVESECGGDVLDLAATYQDEGLLATRILGKTHFLIAPTGEAPLDFVQIEVEEVREVTDRPLIDPDNLPDDIEDVLDPMDPEKVEPEAVAGPRYQLRRALHFAACASDADKGCGDDPRFHRFLEDWSRSSAGPGERFSDHWILTLLPYTDRFGEERHWVKPRSVDTVPPIDKATVERGSALARLIHDFDREVGYPMAWFFLMVTNHRVPHEIAQTIHEDLMGAYAYLPAKDLKILKAWIKDPYTL